MAILERVAVHQTRLRVPGVGLDARGVALGARGLVLFPSFDRLVAFLAVYTEDHALEPLLAGLRVEILESRLGTREVALSIEAGSSDRLDVLSEVARIVGAFTFTGTSRHYVEYRNASAPFGWDAVEIMPTDCDVALYHTTFSQVYSVVRALELLQLLLGLRPRPEPAAGEHEGLLWVLAEHGVGPSLARHLVRSRVAAQVAVVEWPPPAGFDDGPHRRWLFRIPELPPRLRRLTRGTPGLAAFAPATAGAAVELGYRHPVTLRACPVFGVGGLALFRGRGEDPLLIPRMPALADVANLGRMELSAEPTLVAGAGSADPLKLEIPVRLVPGIVPSASPSAALVPEAELPLLRRLAYVLPRGVLERTRVAFTEMGAFLLAGEGEELVPLGRFYRRAHPQVYIPSGLTLSPPIDPALLFTLLGAPGDHEIFYTPEGRALGIPRAAFLALDRALLQPERWVPVVAQRFDTQAGSELPVLWLEPLGVRPLAGAEP